MTRIQRKLKTAEIAGHLFLRNTDKHMAQVGVGVRLHICGGNLNGHGVQSEQFDCYPQLCCGHNCCVNVSGHNDVPKAVLDSTTDKPDDVLVGKVSVVVVIGTVVGLIVVLFVAVVVTICACVFRPCNDCCIRTTSRNTRYSSTSTVTGGSAVLATNQRQMAASVPDSTVTAAGICYVAVSALNPVQQTVNSHATNSCDS
ncbi:uncharacterized protein [Ptychodera flava]|uniref:uncharacterized protein isoform X2 n=1 Tax=Ptychodera flava TaxID=63121 RepID=UPI00396A4630